MNKHLPTPELLRKLLRYEPDTGKLFWRQRKSGLFKDGKRTAERSCRWWNARYAGKEAFTADNGQGYKHGYILNRKHLAHRVIFAMETGDWPILDIDHEDQDRSNNRIENIRDVSRQVNMQNSSLRVDNASGHMGVSWYKPYKKWLASIVIDGRNKHYGYFSSKDAAIAARKAAEAEHGFHENHGRQS